MGSGDIPQDRSSNTPYSLLIEHMKLNFDKFFVLNFDDTFELVIFAGKDGFVPLQSYGDSEVLKQSLNDMLNQQRIG